MGTLLDYQKKMKHKFNKCITYGRVKPFINNRGFYIEVTNKLDWHRAFRIVNRLERYYEFMEVTVKLIHTKQTYRWSITLNKDL